MSYQIIDTTVLDYVTILINSNLNVFILILVSMYKTYDEKYITKVIKSSYISANSNVNLMINKNTLSEENTGHSTYFETKYKSFFSFIFKQLLQKMFDMGSMSIVN